MPYKPLKFCRKTGCRELVTSGYCDKHTPARAYDKLRDNSTKRGYDSRWRKARDAYLARHPLCAECERAGQLTPATVVDHIVPHKGDYSLFWDHTNWQPLCKRCHDAKTNSQDGGFGNRSAHFEKHSSTSVVKM